MYARDFCHGIRHFHYMEMGNRQVPFSYCLQNVVYDTVRIKETHQMMLRSGTPSKSSPFTFNPCLRMFLGTSELKIYNCGY